MPWIRWTANDIARCVCCASPRVCGCLYVEAIQNPGTSQPASVFHMTKKMIVLVRRQNSTKPWRSGGQDCFHGRAGGAVAVFGALW